jgi:hypothetical protein
MGILNSQFRATELHLAIMDDGEARGVPFEERDRRTLIARSESEGSSFIYVTLPSFGRAIDRGLVTGSFTTPGGFALLRGTKLPKFLNRVLSTVFSSDGILLEQPNIDSIFFLRQLLLINGKVIKTPSKDEEEKAVRGFEERQLSLRKVTIPKDHPVLNIAQALLRKALRNLDLSDIIPRHGPGVVHEGRDREEKWDFTYWPLRANKLYPFSEYGVQSLEHLKTKSNSVIFLNRMVTKICLVPKDFRGPRLISAEMSAMQYLQQGQMRLMMDYIDSHPLMRLSIRLRDQTRNQNAAARSYENGTFTLDLSDASDLVSLPLVWFLLSGVPHVRRYLCATRSQAATYGGRLIDLVAFAPMGSATCFPVETLVFWAITMASLHLHRYGRTLRSFQALSELASEVCVFGDDIIAPEMCRETLISTLQSVGCKPNMDKTCWQTPFRESCGTEWFRGFPVSITRNKGYTYESFNKFAHVPVLSDLQRRLFVTGLYKAASVVRGWVEGIFPLPLLNPQVDPRLYPDRIPRTSVCSACEIGRMDPVSYRNWVLQLSGLADYVQFAERGSLPRLRLRYNPLLQRVEARVTISRQRNRNWGTEGYARLLARLLSDSSDRVATGDCKVSIAWRALPAGSWSFMTKSSRG